MQKKRISTRKKKTPKIRKKVAILAVAVMLSISTLSLGIVAAKYIKQRNSTGLVGAAEFYFTSNLLDRKEHTLAPGSTSVTFTLGNHADDLRFSDVNIEYKVTVNNSDATVNNASGTIANDKVNDAEVTISNLKAGTYIITAVGEGGYTKTLTATIVIPKQNTDIHCKIDDTSVDGCVILTVWNEGEKAGTVTITYTGVPDNTNPNMINWLSGDSVSENVTINAHQSKVYRFFGGTVSVTGASTEKN